MIASRIHAELSISRRGRNIEDENVEVGVAEAETEDTPPRLSRKEAKVKTNKVCPTPPFLRFLAPALTDRIGD
jgi:hypothetical protein